MIQSFVPHLSNAVATTFMGLIAFFVIGISILIALSIWKPRPFRRVLVRGLSWGPVYVFFMGGIMLGKVEMTVGCLFLSLRALYELFALDQRRFSRPVMMLCALCTGVFYTALMLYGWSVATMALLVLCSACIPYILVHYEGFTDFGTRLGRVLLYLGVSTFCLGSLAALCWLPWEQAQVTLWSDALLLAVMTPQLSDCLQYIMGKWLGKRVIYPNVSPSKTLEGALGGVFITMLCTTPLALAVLPFSWFQSVALVLLLCVLGIAGDLFLSALKREADIKDYPLLLPEFGGVLDRVDSLVLCAPFFLFFSYFVLLR